MSPQLKELLELVNSNYSSHHRAAFYARRIGLAPDTLNRLCRNELGINVRQVVAGKIIERAKALLPAYSTADVADALGFGSRSGLSGYFKRHTGESIEQYRSHGSQ